MQSLEESAETLTLHNNSTHPVLCLCSSSVCNGNLVFHIMHLYSRTSQQL